MPSFFRSNRPHTLYAALIFLVVTVLFGGASRYNVGTSIVPRLAALIALVYLFWRRHGSPIKIERPVLVFWLLLFAVPLIQLIPLPWSVWTALPGRGLARDVYTAIGVQPWLPISLSPSRTLDFLLALFVPLAAYLLGSHLDFAGRAVVLRAMLALALISAVVGLLQLTSGSSSPLYFYHITNDDSSVGFFANANHLSLFLAGAIIIALAWLGDSMAVTGRIVAPAVVSAGVAVAVLLFGIAGTSSRAGAIFSVIALVGGMTMLPFERVGLRRSYVLGGAAAVTIALAAGLGLVLSGTLLSGRFAWGSDTQERVNLLPQFGRIIHDFFPFGSGLGSFEPIFKSYEKAQELNFGYWNQAHHDYAQVAIEAGLAGIALVLAFLVWYGFRVVGIWRNGDESSRVRRQQATAALFMALVLLHSGGDYPMRTGAIAATFAFLAAFLTAPNESRTATRRRSRGKLANEAFPGYEQN
ncbi:MAG: O-antigen ligase domain-containing protein [Sphingomonas sp.]|uniref:O-antigen ligase family protein n=1 Tax=Sphingomonas sp. TaxID=28214 RepID=UPI001215F873|nr:O-antigen ligase family protein [Sphingomonas sp.]THD37167.1 MAG: O-antigen ligase domain-containing protein [Sphingomonas sp.]